MNKHIHDSNTAEAQHPEEHHSWLHNIIEKMQNLDADFPLSGGEPHPHVHYHAPVVHVENHTDAVDLKHEDHNKHDGHDEHKHHTWLGTLVEKMQNLDADFPLSGGDPHHHSH